MSLEKTGRQIISVVRKAFSELADQKLEKQIIGVFLSRLESEGSELRESLRKTGENLTVITAFGIDPEEREAISGKIRALTGGKEVSYLVDKDILAGIELRPDGYLVSWHLNQYLKDLGEEFGRALEKGHGRNEGVKAASYTNGGL